MRQSEIYSKVYSEIYSKIKCRWGVHGYQRVVDQRQNSEPDCRLPLCNRQWRPNTGRSCRGAAEVIHCPPVEYFVLNTNSSFLMQNSLC